MIYTTFVVAPVATAVWFWALATRANTVLSSQSVRIPPFLAWGGSSVAAPTTATQSCHPCGIVDHCPPPLFFFFNLSDQLPFAGEGTILVGNHAGRSIAGARVRCGDGSVGKRSAVRVGTRTGHGPDAGE